MSEKFQQISFMQESSLGHLYSLHNNDNHYHSSIPRNLTQAHYDELVHGSGISPEIVKANFASVEDSGLIAKILGWKRYEHTPGWVAPIKHPAKQFKPDEPIDFGKGGKPAKYLAQKASYDAMLLEAPEAVWGTWQDVAHDTSETLWITEGAKKAGSVMSSSFESPCIALPGVWMFSIGGKLGKLVPSLAKIVAEGKRDVVIAFDSDWRSKKGVADAINVLAERLKDCNCNPLIAVWDENLGKGIDDVIVELNGNKLKRHVKLMPYSEWFSLASQIFPRLCSIIPKWSDIELAAYIAERYRGKLGFNFQAQQWMTYQDSKGYWEREQPQLVAKLIKDSLLVLSDNYYTRFNEYPRLNKALVWSVRDLLEGELGQKDWNTKDGYIPFKNGLLNLKSMQLERHAPGYRFTWALPYEYNPKATCQPIIDWFSEMLYHDGNAIQFIRAYLNAVVKSRTDLQVFLELIGAGGTGKSTVIKLAKALVGKGNSHTSSLKKLETSKFESSNLYGKKLVEVTDSERYSGGASMLKALTGGDALPFEQKNKQPTEGFYPKCLLILAANEQPQSGDYTSGLQRRRKTIYMNRQIQGSNQRNLIDFYGDTVRGEFAKYIPGLMNWVLELKDDEVADIIRQDLSTSKTAIKETNPLAAWLYERCHYNENSKTKIGTAKKTNGEYQNVDSQLYANYCDWADGSNRGNINLQRFSAMLLDLLQNQLKLQHCQKVKTKHGMHITGVSLTPHLGLPFSAPELLGEDLEGEDEDLVKTQVKAETTVYGESEDGEDLNKNTTNNQSPALPAPNNPSGSSPSSLSSQGKGLSQGEEPSPGLHPSPLLITRATKCGLYKVTGTPEGVKLALAALERGDFVYYYQLIDYYQLTVEETSLPLDTSE
jgi:putative DNA primase/helicase